MRKFDFGLLVAIVINFILGIYKILLADKHKTYSFVFGIILISISLYLLFQMIKEQGSK